MLEKPTAKCSVCDTPFPYRKGKLYCSNNCKQKAYVTNALTDGIQVSPVMQTNQYSLTEYKNYTESCGSFPLVYYMFLRRNISVSASIEDINNYINGLYEEMDFEDKIVKSEAYRCFREDFFSNKFTLVP